MRIVTAIRRLARLLPFIVVAAVAPLAATPLGASAADPAGHGGPAVSHVRHTLSPAPQARAATCQQQSFAWLLTNNGSLISTSPGLSVTTSPNGPLTFTGVAEPSSIILFDFFDARTGGFVNEVQSNGTGGNCVANQRTIPANFVLPVGSFDVIASFIPWEAPSTVRQVNMGTLTT
jgi:hypothetical protein